MRSAVFTAAFVLGISLLFAVGAEAQTPPPQPPPATPAAQPTGQAQPADAAAAFPWEGEITGTNVYVRSGAGVNWYPTAKLNPGDRVLVLGEKFGWYQVVPPKGSFSYIDKAVVDRQAPDSKVGTVKQDKVYIRAGSEVEDRKSATQLVVDKGVKVEILGEVEGFYKITPPRGASLFVSKTYVEPVAPRLRTGLHEQYSSVAPAESKPEAKPGQTPPAEPSAASPTSPGQAPAQPGAGAVAGDTGLTSTTQPAREDEGLPLETDESIESLQKKATAAPKPATGKTPPGAPPIRGKDQPAVKPAPARPRYDVMLSQVENLLQAELRRPLKEQDLTPLLNRYEEIAAQKEENIPAQIAKVRLQQLRDWQGLAATKDDSASSAAELASFREKLNAERMKIASRRVEEAALKYDLEGELRRSWAFANQQHRYRLVDPAKGTTIAYVDIPPTVDVNANNLIGRVVGIVASEKQFSTSARVPVAVAAKVVDLSPRSEPGSTPNPERAQPPENTESPKDKSTTEAAKEQAGKPAPNKPVAVGQNPDPAQ